MKTDHLIHFLETARHQHLTKAARLLRVSPSGVSHSIACLEEELGVKLFEKRGKRIFLTGAGQRLLGKIPDVQRSLFELRQHVSSELPAFQGHFRVGATHLLAESLLAPALAKLFADNPAVTADIFSLRSAEVVARVLDGQLELGICFSPQSHPRLESRCIAEGQLKVYLRPGHPLLKKKNPWAGLSSLPAILPKAFGGIDICEKHPVFLKHGIVPSARFAFDHYGVGSALVARTEGWGFFPDWLEKRAGFELRALRLPASWDAPYSIHCLFQKGVYLDPGIQRLINAVKETP
ncbi:LysR family transcriptional regulator [bacterium]|nr:LysR family transcriptional regulator [bacterium]